MQLEPFTTSTLWVRRELCVDKATIQATAVLPNDGVSGFIFNQKWDKEDYIYASLPNGNMVVTLYYLVFNVVSEASISSAIFHYEMRMQTKGRKKGDRDCFLVQGQMACELLKL